MTSPDSIPGSTPEIPIRPWRRSPSPRQSRVPITFRALRHRNYRLWFGGQGISLIGTWMQMVAMQVLVYRMTGSAAALGIVAFIGLIPTIPLTLWGGSLADRVSKRTVILAAQARPAGQTFDIVEDSAASPAEFLGYLASSHGLSAPGHAPRYAAWAQPNKTQVALMGLNPHANSAKAQEALGWQPRFPTYKQGIDDALLSWRAAVEVK